MAGAEFGRRIYLVRRKCLRQVVKFLGGVMKKGRRAYCSRFLEAEKSFRLPRRRRGKILSGDRHKADVHDIRQGHIRRASLRCNNFERS